MTGTLAPGIAAAGAVVAVIGSALAALIGTGPAAVLGDAYLRHVVLFTLAQTV